MICIIKNYFENGLWKVRPNIQYFLEILSSSSSEINKLLFTLFLIKLYDQVNIFKTIKKHGQDIYKLTKTLEDKVTKHLKVKLDIIFIEQCKKENTIPTFAKVNVSIKHGTYKL